MADEDRDLEKRQLDATAERAAVIESFGKAFSRPVRSLAALRKSAEDRVRAEGVRKAFDDLLAAIKASAPFANSGVLARLMGEVDDTLSAIEVDGPEAGGKVVGGGELRKRDGRSALLSAISTAERAFEGLTLPPAEAQYAAHAMGTLRGLRKALR